MKRYSLPPEFPVKIERIVFEGDGLGYYEDPNSNKKARPVFVAGVFPGETVSVRPSRVTGKFVKARLEKILNPDQKRQPPRDPSHLSTSPWQVVPYELQLKWKRETVCQMWQHAVGKLPTENLEISGSPIEWAYRNKLEYSVIGAAGSLELAFRERGKWNAFVACPTGTAIASAELNAAANAIVAELNKQQIPVSSVKNILVRQSFTPQKVVAVLFVTDPKIQPFTLPIELAAGFRIIYSDPQRSDNVETKIISEQGEMELTETINGVTLNYGYRSFFQVNPAAFTMLIECLKENLSDGKELLDLYAGVGAIGFALKDQYQKITSIEVNPEAVEFAQRNAALNQITAEISGGEVEKQKISEKIQRADTVVIDPPRAGLHPKALDELIAAAPKNLVYVSCNPATQARDFAKLSEIYDVRLWRLFDFYPQTPHVESLLILEKK